MPSLKFTGFAAMLALAVTDAFVVSNVPPTPPAAIERVVPATADLTTGEMWASSLNSQMLLSGASANVAQGFGIIIDDIRYDGEVSRTEADEFVVIKNRSKETADISGWFIYPAGTGTQGNTFYFPAGSVLKPNQSARIYTNEIHKETGGYSWGSGKALWSNNGGLAVMKDNNGKKIMEYKYKPVVPAKA
mmetsp:Transcript_977/g.904  ORF Transcript_977/g.904 Transcript_977/m.904 type:complete len:190 (+) Transcript_977:92-661(+)